MDAPGWETLFIGDLDDPWSLGIAAALPAGTRRLHCGGDLPESWPEVARQARSIVLHRPAVALMDHDRLRRLRERPEGQPAPRLFLCLGAQARQRQVERCAPLVDTILPEATARWTIGRHFLPPEVPGANPARKPIEPSVVIVSQQTEMRAMLADACRRGGFAVRPARDWSTAAIDGLALWEVPVLEPDWPCLLRAESKHRPVVALLGFADRDLVTQAREAGAFACLDQPCDPADLVWLLQRIHALHGRLANKRIEPGHGVPPRPKARRRPLTPGGPAREARRSGSVSGPGSRGMPGDPE